MQLSNDGNKILLRHEMSLGDLKRDMISNDLATTKVEFYDMDGYKLSYCSKIKNVLEMSSFNMKIDDCV
jgi:hypothetical protein